MTDQNSVQDRAKADQILDRLGNDAEFDKNPATLMDSDSTPGAEDDDVSGYGGPGLTPPESGTGFGSTSKTGATDPQSPPIPLGTGFPMPADPKSPPPLSTKADSGSNTLDW